MSKFQELYNADHDVGASLNCILYKNIPLRLSQGRNSILCSYEIFTQSYVPIPVESQRFGTIC